MTVWEVFWWSVAGGALGCAAVLAFAAVAERLVHKRAERNEARARDEHNTKVENGDEPVDEGKLRVAVRRSASPAERIPFRDPNDAPEPSLSGRELFEKRQAQADAAAVRRGEETRPIATIRHEMLRVMLCEPPMVEGVTLFAYLKHHAQPSGLAWDSENMGVLANVTQALYEGVQRDPLVADVFGPYDLDVLRRHFVKALMTLAKDGLDVETADDLKHKHAHLRIRPEQFDAVIGHFVQALKGALQSQVFESVLGQLSPAVCALRARIVTAAGAA
jgi:truncated hemoglobin YjbI